MQTLTVLYRGALETCNYACGYCPFAKRKETKQKKVEDTTGLEQFISWLNQQSMLNFNLFFTPWGEALVFKRYQQAISSLTKMANINKVVFQTNLSSKLDFLNEVDCTKLRLWCTYHPTEITRQRFIEKTKQLDSYGVKYSVGMVGQPSLFAEIAKLRDELNPATYLWINSYVENNQHYSYSEQQQRALTSIDPLFSLNKIYGSKGLACFAGESVITVDEFGDIRRCHFIKQVIGNIHDPNWQQILQPRSCSANYCDCHIGYAHLKSLKLEQYFGDQLLERIALQF